MAITGRMLVWHNFELMPCGIGDYETSCMCGIELFPNPDGTSDYIAFVEPRTEMIKWKIFEVCQTRIGAEKSLRYLMEIARLGKMSAHAG